jgi:hypothetical protein
MFEPSRIPIWWLCGPSLEVPKGGATAHHLPIKLSARPTDSRRRWADKSIALTKETLPLTK